MARPHRMAAVAVAGAMLASGCYGTFELTRRVYRWNGEVSDNKWVVEGVYLLLSWLPVYGLAGAADAIIFNSVEFWTGSNPLVGADAGHAAPSKRIVRGEGEVVLERVPGPQGEQLVITQFLRGVKTSSLAIRRHGELTVATDSTGALLYQARMLDDGGVVVTDGAGAQVASYSGDEVNRLVKSVTQ